MSLRGAHLLKVFYFSLSLYASLTIATAAAVVVVDAAAVASIAWCNGGGVSSLAASFERQNDGRTNVFGPN